MVANRELYLADEVTPITKLEVATHFNALTEKEKRYAHHIARASWFGTRIVLQQVSKESEWIYNLILSLFEGQNVDSRLAELKAAAGAEALDGVLGYFTQFLGNMGNYKSFGDTKFIPRVSEQQFEAVVKASKSEEALKWFNLAKERMYSLNEKDLMLGAPDKHTTTYYSEDMTMAEVAVVQKYLEVKNTNAYNTRVWKEVRSARPVYCVRFASSELLPTMTTQFEGVTIEHVYGDYKACMAQIVKELKAAVAYAANDIEKQMLLKYVESFEKGDIEAHKESQRFWIKDVSPRVESNIGFIESYRDPAGVRGEWEGFVSIVNQEQTKKFEKLVNCAKAFIEKLPWGVAFEKDEFRKPDFTSLEVLAFCTSGLPAGINIPNYDDIRMNDGFKNVSLGNVLNSPKASTEVITFLSEADLKLFEKFKGPAFEVQVGIHELLGHGSGKLLEETKDGKFNFDPTNPPVNPLTGKPVTSWYKPGETFGSKFGVFASSYEECRAESCGIYLSTEEDILKIFGHEGEEAQDVLYVNWLLMVRAGLLALEFYNPESKQWGQAHMRARFGILRVLLNAGEGLVKIEQVNSSDLLIRLDRSKIKTVGLKAIGHFLTELQVYKAIADEKKAAELYDKYTSVPNELLAFRKIVLDKRQPRKVYVQPNTFVEGDKILFKEYEMTPIGLLKSVIERNV